MQNKNFKVHKKGKQARNNRPEELCERDPNW